MNLQNENAIIALYRESFPDFARMVRRMGGSLDEAKDSFHDALLIYLEKENSGKLQLRSSPKAYLLGTAKICWLHNRKQGAKLLSHEKFEELEESDWLEGFEMAKSFETATPEDADTEEKENILLESLQKSGKKCLELLKAFYYDYCTMDHIASRFGFKGRRSATVQKYKCLEKVRSEIKKIEIYAQ